MSSASDGIWHVITYAVTIIIITMLQMRFRGYVERPSVAGKWGNWVLGLQRSTPFLHSVPPAEVCLDLGGALNEEEELPYQSPRLCFGTEKPSCTSDTCVLSRSNAVSRVWRPCLCLAEPL